MARKTKELDRKNALRSPLGAPKHTPGLRKTLAGYGRTLESQRAAKKADTRHAAAARVRKHRAVKAARAENAASQVVQGNATNVTTGTAASRSAPSKMQKARGRVQTRKITKRHNRKAGQ